MLWNFVLSVALLAQKWVVALGLGGLLPGLWLTLGEAAGRACCGACTSAAAWPATAPAACMLISCRRATCLFVQARRW